MKSARDVQSHVTDLKGTVGRAKPGKVKEQSSKKVTYNDEEDPELAKKMKKLQDIKDKIDSRI